MSRISTFLSSYHRTGTIWLNKIQTFCNFKVRGKSLSEALIFASPNPQYNNRLFIELRVQFMKIASSEHVVYINCSECQNKKNNLCTQQVLSLQFSFTEDVIQ